MPSPLGSTSATLLLKKTERNKGFPSSYQYISVPSLSGPVPTPDNPIGLLATYLNYYRNVHIEDLAIPKSLTSRDVHFNDMRPV